MPSGAESKIREAIDIAMKHQAEGRLRAAGNIYRRVLRVEPENPDALHFLGVIAHKIGRADLAMELLARSIAADPARVGFRMNLGSLYLKQQQVDAAIACYRDAIALEPKSASAYAHLAAALARQGKLEEANDAYGRATELKGMPNASAPQVESAAPVSEPEPTPPPVVAMAAPEPAAGQGESAAAVSTADPTQEAYSLGGTEEVQAPASATEIAPADSPVGFAMEPSEESQASVEFEPKLSLPKNCRNNLLRSRKARKPRYRWNGRLRAIQTLKVAARLWKN